MGHCSRDLGAHGKGAAGPRCDFGIVGGQKEGLGQDWQDPTCFERATVAAVLIPDFQGQ